MFYSEFVLAKKGALGKVWLAAHWEKKLTRNQISKSNIVEACNSIIKPVAPMALRTSGHLLLGVVRIHDGKQKSLMVDCSDALTKIKLAFRPGNVDLPVDRITANYNAITQGPEDLDANFEEEFPAVEDGGSLSETQLNIGTMEQITMQEFDPIVHDVVPAPEMSGFGDEIPAPGNDENSFDSGLQPEDIEVGRDAVVTDDPYQPNDTTIDSSRADLDQTADHTLDVSAIPNDSMIEAGFGDDLDQTGVGGDTRITPGLDDTVLEEVEDIEFQLDTTADRPLEPLKEKAAGPTLKLSRRKRKLVVDDKAIEISSAEIKRNLEPTGCDDILLQPYSEMPRETFVFKRAPYSRKGIKHKLKNMTPEALFNSPSSGPWGSRLTEIWNKCREFEPSEEMLASRSTETAIENVEVGRRNAEDLPSHNFEDISELPPDDELRPEEHVDFEPPIMDDPSLVDDINNTLDNTAAESRLDDTAVDSLLLDDDEDETTAQVTASQYAQQDHLTKRTTKMLNNLRAGFETADELSYSAMTDRKSRRVAAACFFELLVLKTKDYVQIEQPEPYDDIKVTPTESLVASTA